ncbi:MAG: hypothetical protein ACYTAO_17360, partial [Planctomycetota bacterium]
MNEAADWSSRNGNMKHSAGMLLLLPAVIMLAGPDAGLAARGPARTMAAVRTDVAPVIDGKLDEPCWSKANIATDFTD